jgi:tRNA pseudouridine-54 N-methylase
MLLRKTLASHADEAIDGFVEARPGVAIARGGLDSVLTDLGSAPGFIMTESGPDVRQASDLPREAAFFLGDHLGFDEPTRRRLDAARPLSVGPRSLHTEDVIAVVLNELDRRTFIG